MAYKITKNGKRRYRASVPVPGHPQRRVQKLFPDDTPKSKKAAERWEVLTKEQLKNQIDTICVSSIEWAEKYLDHVRTRCVKKTYDEKRKVFERLFTFKKGIANVAVEDLTAELANDFLSHQCNTRSGNAANKDRKNLVAAWTWGVKTMTDFTNDRPNPFAGIDKFPEQKQPRYVPPETDFWKVYSIAEGQDKVMLLSYLHLAGRRRELFRMTKSDIDFHNKKVKLWTRKRKNGTLESDTLPMTDELTRVLQSWCEFRFSLNIEDQEHVFVCLDEYHFCKDYYGKPFKNRQHLMKRLCKKAGVKHFGFHGIRHLTGHILYGKGKSVGFIQKVLRHKNATTTQIYLRTLGLEDVREGLNEALPEPSDTNNIINFDFPRTGTCNG